MCHAGSLGRARRDPADAPLAAHLIPMTSTTYRIAVRRLGAARAVSIAGSEAAYLALVALVFHETGSALLESRSGARDGRLQHARRAARRRARRPLRPPARDDRLPTSAVTGRVRRAAALVHDALAARRGRRHCGRARVAVRPCVAGGDPEPRPHRGARLGERDRQQLAHDRPARRAAAQGRPGRGRRGRRSPSSSMRCRSSARRCSSPRCADASRPRDRITAARRHVRRLRPGSAATACCA